MELYRSASLQSQFRGYDYFQDNKVISFKRLEDSMYSGKVKGSSATYNVIIDIEHPKKNSHCNCPHAEGTKIIYKHMMALYFTIFPQKAKQFMEEIDEHNKEVKEYEQELEIKMQKYIKSMSKKELEENLLECLYQVDWLYDNFIRDRVGC